MIAIDITTDRTPDFTGIDEINYDTKSAVVTHRWRDDSGNTTLGICWKVTLADDVVQLIKDNEPKINDALRNAFSVTEP